MIDAMSQPKKRGRKPLADKAKDRSEDRHTRPRESFHLDRELQSALERLTADSSPRVSKSAVIVAALQSYLAGKGYWRAAP